MRSPRSSAQLAAEKELIDAALLALRDLGYYHPQVVRAERVADGVVEALFTIEQAAGGRAARLAVIRTDRGAPCVDVVTGWPVRR